MTSSRSILVIEDVDNSFEKDEDNGVSLFLFSRVLDFIRFRQSKLCRQACYRLLSLVC